MSVVARRASNTPLLNAFFIGTIFVLVLIYLYLLIRVDEDKSGITRLYLLGLIQLTPFIICFVRQKFNYIAFIMVNHCFAFTVSTYNFAKNLDVVDTLPDSTQYAISENMRCAILMIVAYYACRYFLFFSFKECRKYEYLSMPREWFTLVFLYVVLFPAYMHYVPPQILIIHLTLVAADLVLLFTSTVRGKDILSKIARTGAFFSAVWYFFKTGMLTMVGNYAAFYFVVSCLQVKYKNFIFLILITLSASAVQVVKEDFRTLSKGQPSVIERVILLGDLLALEYLSDERADEGETDEKLLTGFARLGDASLERVLTMTPSQVPFWNGETYASIPFMFIPRALWPEKPSRHFWNKFGKAYGYLSPDDNQTSVAVSFLAEAYMNFGFAGMYTLAILFGILICFVERLSYAFLNGHFAFTFVVFLLPLMSYAQDLGSILNSLVLSVGVIVLIRPFLVKMAKKDVYGSYV